MLILCSQIISLFLINLIQKSVQQNTGFIWQSHPLTTTNSEISNDINPNSRHFVPAHASKSANFQEDSFDFVFPNDNDRYPNNNNNPIRQQTNTNVDEGRQFNWDIPNGGSTFTTPSRPATNHAYEDAITKCEQNCLSTSQYDPVCGDDFKTYHNEGKLRCAQRCGKNVKILSRIPCGSRN